MFAGYYAGNGNGDMTGTHWIEKSGLLETPILGCQLLGCARPPAPPIVAGSQESWIAAGVTDTGSNDSYLIKEVRQCAHRKGC